MRYIIVVLVWFILFFTGCKTSDTVANSSKELKSNQYKGVVQELTMPVKLRGGLVLKDFYFTTSSKNYFIKFSEGYVSKEEAMKFLGKEIIIKGEIKNGAWEDFPPYSAEEQKTLKAPRSGEYIVLEKIYKP
ncbi:MAG: hypothetical protein H6587_04125 [Flavobacteriales bacterium]|nr:hypothetical protein [Flavobacteriales bacterium]MCB9363736.1 hypothetical protein [Flavobacteriales bacterium]